ncbi:hypothetical protein BDW74DRAFT_146570 [Aspergillus multicolor]|uniref:uncharacterized protein n=1 Tax=Aspergillus multicolor TaxID=41759 RepID=UPI003CCDE2D7
MWKQIKTIFILPAIACLCYFIELEGMEYGVNNWHLAIQHDSAVYMGPLRVASGIDAVMGMGCMRHGAQMWSSRRTSQ